MIKKYEKPTVGFLFCVFGLSLLAALNGCKTKGDIRREQEMERLKSDVKEARDIKADLDTTVEELRLEVARLTSVNEEQAAIHRNVAEELRNQVVTLQTRVQALEQRAVSEELAAKQPPSKPSASSGASLEKGKKLYEEGKFEEAEDVLREVLRGASKGSETAKKAQFLVAEVLFSSKEYASSALEFSDFRKNYPKDSLVPTAMYRQAWACKNLGKNQDAKLFFKELIELHPTHQMGQRAKNDLKKMGP